MKLEKKICLGTAQFGYRYGLIKKNKISLKEIKKILSYIKKKKIDYLDTALSYGKSQKIIGNFKTKNLKIISKITIKSSSKNISEELKTILKELKTKKIYALLIHNSEILLKKKYSYIFKQLTDLKKKKLIKKIGISVYNPKVLNKILKKFKFDLVQFPGNLFDTRFLKNLDNYKSAGLELHVRSVFLQGVLLINNTPMRLRKYSNILNRYYKFLNNNDIDPIHLCINFILQFKKIDKIVIGVNSLNELKQIVENKKIEKKYLKKKFYLNNSKLIDPRKW